MSHGFQLLIAFLETIHKLLSPDCSAYYWQLLQGLRTEPQSLIFRGFSAQIL
jgi:hypothetical protein